MPCTYPLAGCRMALQHVPRRKQVAQERYQERGHQVAHALLVPVPWVRDGHVPHAYSHHMPHAKHDIAQFSVANTTGRDCPRNEGGLSGMAGITFRYHGHDEAPLCSRIAASTSADALTKHRGCAPVPFASLAAGRRGHQGPCEGSPQKSEITIRGREGTTPKQVHNLQTCQPKSAARITTLQTCGQQKECPPAALEARLNQGSWVQPCASRTPPRTPQGLPSQLPEQETGRPGWP